MLKVLIADDEMKVCQLIYYLVKWNEMGMEVIDIVNDGKKAFDTICEKMPDIVITDIRMPNYDGIELIRKTKEILPETYFIIISGYNQFEYAKSAIQYGVENYLLKPIKRKELVNTLTKIIEKHSIKLSDTSERSELKHLLQTSEEKVKKNLLAELLMNPDSGIIDQSIDILNKDYLCHFTKGCYTILVIRPFLKLEDRNRETLSLLLTKILCVAKEKLELCCQEVIVITWEEQVYCLINTEDSVLYSVKKQLNKIRIEIANLKDIFHNVQIIIGIGRVTQELKDLNITMKQAELSIMNRFSKAGEYIIEYQNSFEAGKSVSDIIDSSTRSKIISYFELFDIENILKEITEIQKVLAENLEDGKLIYQCYNEIINTILFCAKNYMNPNEFPNQKWYQMKFMSFKTMDEIFNWLMHQLREKFDQYMIAKKKQDNKPIRLAKQYINENYSREINLERVSALVGFNPAYFSALFKKETGENFMEYVIKVRVQNAKTLLIQTDFEIFEIAEKVGYMDLKYFSKLFKKRTGLSPSEFRKLYG